MEGKWGLERVTAKGHVVAMVLEREDFIKVVGSDMGSSIIRNTVDKKKLVSIFVHFDFPLCDSLVYFPPLPPLTNRSRYEF